MDYSETAQRISRKFLQKNQTVDVLKIEGKLRRLVDEFGVLPSEAERSVTNELLKEFNLPIVTTGSGSSPGGATEQKKIADAIPGDWVTFEAKVVSLSTPASPAIAQSGILADESGAIRFVVWTKANAPAMTEGLWYRIESAVVDEYKNIPSLKVHSGTTIKELGTANPLIPVPAQIKDLHTGVGSVRAKVVQEWDVTHERMLQQGLLADETGTIKFVLWKEPGKRTARSRLSLLHILRTGGRVQQQALFEPEHRDTHAGRGGTCPRSAAAMLPYGAPSCILHTGSGIIKRCPVEGCNRALSRQNYCPIHEIQPNFVYDLRIKGWLDDGEKTHNILIQRDVVESLTKIPLDAAIQIAENNPLGMDEVFLRMRDALLGRYVICRGREIDNRLLVNSCERLTFESGEHAALLNRAGGAS